MLKKTQSIVSQQCFTFVLLYSKTASSGFHGYITDFMLVLPYSKINTMIPMFTSDKDLRDVTMETQQC
jgi:hypothetical protein